MKESIIQSAIENYLSLLENTGRLIYIKNNSGALPTIGGGFIRFGKSGSSDFLVFLPKGKLICLEVKNEKGKLTNNQELFKTAIERLGFSYFMVRAVDEVEEIIQKYATNTT